MKHKTRKKMAVRKQQETKRQSGRLRSIIAGVTIGAIVVVASTALWVSWDSQQEQVVQQEKEQLMPIRLVEIIGGLERVTRDEIQAVLRQQSIDQQSDERGVNFLTTDIQQLEDSLAQLPWVYRAQLRRVWPDKLIINIQEQVVVAQWNENQLVNQFGELFTPAEIPELEVPELSGADDSLPNMLQKFQDLQRMFESADLQMHGLHMNSRQSWQIKLVNGIELQLGRKDLVGRVKRFIDLYPLLKSDSQPIERVDLRYDTGLAVMRFESPLRQASL